MQPGREFPLPLPDGADSAQQSSAPIQPPQKLFEPKTLSDLFGQR